MSKCLWLEGQDEEEEEEAPTNMGLSPSVWPRRGSGWNRFHFAVMNDVNTTGLIPLRHN